MNEEQPQVGDVWEYDERCGHSHLIGQRRSIRSEEGHLGTYDGDQYTGRASNSLANIARLISRAGQPVTAEHDRSGCKAWCGLPYMDRSVPVWAGGRHGARYGAATKATWCSARCGALRLPPLGEKPSVTADQAWQASRCSRCLGPIDPCRQGCVFDRPTMVYSQMAGRGRKIIMSPDLAETARRILSEPAPRKHPPGVQCKRCLCTSERGDVHLETCAVTRESGPSAVAKAPERRRDTFADLATEWDLLPDAR